MLFYLCLLNKGFASGGWSVFDAVFSQSDVFHKALKPFQTKHARGATQILNRQIRIDALLSQASVFVKFFNNQPQLCKIE